MRVTSSAACAQRALTRLANDAELRARLAGGARATIEELGLTWHRNAARVAQLFRDLCQSAGTGGATAVPETARARTR